MKTPTMQDRTTLIHNIITAVERSAYSQQGARTDVDLSTYRLTPSEFGFLLTEAEVIHGFDTLSETEFENWTVQIVGTISKFHPEEPKSFVVKVWL